MSDQAGANIQVGPDLQAVNVVDGKVSFADYQKLAQAKEAELVHIERIYNICVKTNTELQNENDQMVKAMDQLKKEKESLRLGYESVRRELKETEFRQEGAAHAYEIMIDKALDKIKEN